MLLFFVHAKAALVIVEMNNMGVAVSFNRPDEGRIKNPSGSYNLHFVSNSQN